MTRDSLDRLRAADPLPHGSSAPPLEQMLTRIAADAPPPHRRRRWKTGLVPALAAAVCAVIVAVVIIASGTHDTRRSTPSITRSGPAHTAIAVPAGGMPGLIFLNRMAFADASHGLISFTQCLGYHNGDPTKHAVCRSWLASTANGGITWTVQRRGYQLDTPQLRGADGWAEGLQSRAGGGGIARFYVTHDAGRTWSVAASPAPALGNQQISLGGAEVWAVGSGCCSLTIQHAAMSASHMVATAAQPISGDWTNVQVLAAGRHAAYVINPDDRTQAFATLDDGHSWQRITPPCPPGRWGTAATDGNDTVIWGVCQPRHGSATLITRSTDGGRTWQRSGTVMHLDGLGQLQVVSPLIAWAHTDQGAVWQTVDGGAHWTQVWSASTLPASLRSHPPLNAAVIGGPLLAVSGGGDAHVVTIITRGRNGQQARLTNLVIDRTTNGGLTWTPTVIRLP
jgi:photosystem II stability/assembly factor-like uncharacterized protein